jgi:hypothetical protein
MNDIFEPTAVQAVQALYEKSADARKLFEWTASLKKDAAETSIERIMSALGISRKAAVTLAQDLAEAGCGNFIVGRRGARSRFSWLYSRISLGKVAVGEATDIDPVSPDLETIAEEEAEISNTPPLTIASAKEQLALSLKIRPDQIEIIIKG